MTTAYQLDGPVRKSVRKANANLFSEDAIAPSQYLFKVPDSPSRCYHIQSDKSEFPIGFVRIAFDWDEDVPEILVAHVDYVYVIKSARAKLSPWLSDRLVDLLENWLDKSPDVLESITTLSSTSHPVRGGGHYFVDCLNQRLREWCDKRKITLLVDEK
ncbi:hypothetical protein [Burkholderia pseudomultivorans]|uniref:hypothetical protein n=1 Tax=Burkholderia pseudomultivorans TaxID=1207504 RepID=UPI00188FAED8|nr:hypothetical protein [Burkholderia pseudomultivorans]MBF5008630.1 hypothetical protein [Burkholderia pseudomultivorans]